MTAYVIGEQIGNSIGLDDIDADLVLKLAITGAMHGAATKGFNSPVL